MNVLIKIEEIQDFLPHRYPMLLVDRVIELELGKYIKAYKNITTNEPFFSGHFPGKQVMPGVLLLEAMAQASGILGFKTMEKKPEEGSIYYYLRVTVIQLKSPFRVESWKVYKCYIIQHLMQIPGCKLECIVIYSIIR